MSKVLVVCALSILAAATGVQAEQPTHSDSDSDRMICRRVSETGSRLASHRVCMTAAQWAEQRRQTRNAIDHAQMTRVEPQGN